MLQVRRSRVFVQVHKVSRRGPQRRVSVAQDFRALIAGRCVPPRRSGRCRAAYRTRDWVTSLFTEFPRRVLLGNSLSCGLERVKGSYSIVGSKRALRRGMWHLYTPLVLLPILPNLLFGHHLARLLLCSASSCYRSPCHRHPCRTRHFQWARCLG
jgi:hypothetical protein